MRFGHAFGEIEVLRATTRCGEFWGGLLLHLDHWRSIADTAAISVSAYDGCATAALVSILAYLVGESISSRGLLRRDFSALGGDGFEVIAWVGLSPERRLETAEEAALEDEGAMAA